MDKRGETPRMQFRYPFILLACVVVRSSGVVVALKNLKTHVKSRHVTSPYKAQSSQFH